MDIQRGFGDHPLMSRIRILWALSFCLASVPDARAQSISLTEVQRKKLAKLVEQDPEAKALFAPLKQSADAALKDAPDPIERIQSEGKLKDDPAKIRTQACMKDMKKLHALGFAYAVTADARYPDKAREFILAWAKVNRSAGDPIDDTGLEPLITAYDLARGRFPEKDRAAVDGWLRTVAEAERKSFKAGTSTSVNNWHSHRLKIVGLIAFLLQDKGLIDYVTGAYKDHVGKNLNPDGSSLDFHERDALHYHTYDLEPLLTLAIAARQNGIDLYGFRADTGGTLEKSVRFLVPYCDGSKTHAEFVKSKVAFDRKRAESGDDRYKAGRPFEPAEGAGVLELAAAFDGSLTRLLIQVKRSPAKAYPTWQTVLNAARK